jgi:hypothetical protein
MEVISGIEKQRLVDFILDNNLDYIINDNGLIRFNIISYDKIVFYFYKYNNQYVIAKNIPIGDKAKEFEYFYFTTLSQVLEQLLHYDNSITKTYWEICHNIIEIGFVKQKYDTNWYSEFIKDEYYSTEDCGEYKAIIYDNTNYKPIIKSSYDINNDYPPTIINKLYFEVHPIICDETYLFKILSNNEESLKDYNSYIVYGKKGLNMFLNNLFNTLK